MDALATRTAEGLDGSLPVTAVSALADRIAGAVITPDSPEYDEARSVWNGMIDRRPALIVRCAGVEDVAECVRFAREHDVRMAVRGAGHNIAGSGVADGALVIDLSGMRDVAVDPAAGRARVEPGATLGDLDEATQAHGLAVPTGINSTTGIAGLALGGGFGWLSRALGLTIDSLVEVEMVDARGNVITANEDENGDLFWAVRGGGGNFGIVTAFHFRLHPVGPEVLSGLIVHPFRDARSVLRGLRAVMEGAPDELTAWAVLRKAPPLPFLAEEWHGEPVVVIAVCYAGPVADGERAVEPLRAIGASIADVIGPQPLVAWQQAFDPLLAAGARNYWKSHDFDAFGDDLLDVIVDAVERLPTGECEIFLGQLGGAVARVAGDATAYGRRDVEFFMNIHTRWQSPEDDDRCLEWARGLFEAAAPFARGTAYVNFMPEDDADRVQVSYGANYPRLAEIKRRYDPSNVFRTNQNIRPAVPA